MQLRDQFSSIKLKRTPVHCFQKDQGLDCWTTFGFEDSFHTSPTVPNSQPESGKKARMKMTQHPPVVGCHRQLQIHSAGAKHKQKHTNRWKISLDYLKRTLRNVFVHVSPVSAWAFLFFSFTHGLACPLGSLPLIVDLDTDTPTSRRVFLIWPTVVNQFFFTGASILLPSNRRCFRWSSQ